ncbi:RING/U-box superfamily protein isoform X3 [Zea mays]|uniref:RING/U-box superfamily protein isoform X3 n=1 Tax=Zea mays TaxID=4577 RepID=UPI0004DEC405|nr:uncharacterized protein LOC100279906 isoform X3 [Zea mays]|eukprot:XP_020396060.1 uncharacterized protein LOC100279906 isoform X3 [Zea mays]
MGKLHQHQPVIKICAVTRMNHIRKIGYQQAHKPCHQSLRHQYHQLLIAPEIYLFLEEIVYMVMEEVHGILVVAAIVILIFSRHEHPHAPLFAWIIGYTLGCIASLPLIYWRYVHRNRHLDQEPQQPPTTYPTLTPSQSSEGRNHRTSGIVLHLGCISISCPRLSVLAYHFKTGVDCFFAVWFVVGNVWIFGGRSISSDAQDAPNMYRLCLAFLALSCVGYAIPFIMCAAICCCFPCLISVLRLQEDLGQNRGATQELIDALPTYKFKPKRVKNWGIDHASSSEHLDEGGILGPGTKKERVVSAEDAVCCICLTKYGDDDELRELPCTHFFHVQCVDKWLKINAVCPLCKTEIGGVVRSFFGLPFGRRRVDRIAARGVASSRFSV